MTITRNGRIAHLPSRGKLFVCSDLHGNLQDYLRMKQLFLSEKNAYLLFLGDLVHGPFFEPEEWPKSFGTYYYDESEAVLDDFMSLQDEHPDRAISLLGNHEHAHIGGVSIHKFLYWHTDEQGRTHILQAQEEILEKRVGAAKAHQYEAFFKSFPLLVTTNTGILFSHTAPRLEQALTLEDLAKISYESCEALSALHKEEHVLSYLLWPRQESAQQTRSFLQSLSHNARRRFDVLVYGHLPASNGYCAVSEELFRLSTSFCMRDDEKKYLVIDLSRKYPSTAHLQEGTEIRGLYED